MLEERIEEIVLDKATIPTLSEGNKVGRVIYEKNAVRDYIRHIKSTVYNSLSGLKIAVDCANGSASTTAKALFEELGAEVTYLDKYTIKIDSSSVNKYTAPYEKVRKNPCVASFCSLGYRRDSYGSRRC